MFNLIKMELYRLCHATSTWVILLVAVATVAAMMALTGAIVDLAAGTEDGVTEQTVDAENEISSEEDSSGDDSSENNVSIGVYVNEDWASEASEETDLTQILASVLQGGVLVLLCVILTATYAYADQKNGYLKNIAGQYPSREKLVLAKCAVTAVAVLVLLAAVVATAAVGAKMIWGSSLRIGSLSELAKMIGVHYLLLLAFSLAILMVTILARSSTAGVIVGVLVSANILSMFCSLINMLVEKVLPNANYDSTLYTIEYYLGSYGAGASSGDTGRAVAVALIYGALAAIAATWVMRKRDVV